MSTPYKPVYTRRYVPVIVLGVPIPGKNNPYLVFPTSNPVHVKASVSSQSKLETSMNIPYSDRAFKVLKESLEIIGEVFGLNLEFSLTLKFRDLISPLQLVSILLYSVLEFVRKNLYSLSREDYFQFLNVISKPIPALLRAPLEGLVLSLHLNSPIVYRRGEGFFKLSKKSVAGISTTYSWVDSRLEFTSNPLLEELTLIIGRTVVEGSNCLINRDLECFLKLFKLDSHISRVLYVGGSLNSTKVLPDLEGHLSINACREV